MKFVVTWSYIDGSGHGVFVICDTREKARQMLHSVQFIAPDRFFHIHEATHIEA